MEWLRDKETFEKLLEGSFKESGTGVNTVLVVIEKLSDSNKDQLAARRYKAICIVLLL
ncbi:hypothetical protein GCM10008915_23470 [Bifidobacterium pullorum subsp. gallinarum]